MTDQKDRHEAYINRQSLGAYQDAAGNLPLVTPTFEAELNARLENFKRANERNQQAIDAIKELQAYMKNNPIAAELIERVNVLTRYPR
jgi:hypothetical protein